MQLLNEKGHSFTTTAEKKIVKDMKQKLGYVAIDYDEEEKNFSPSEIKRYCIVVIVGCIIIVIIVIIVIIDCYY